jgi:hypothetical protein
MIIIRYQGVIYKFDNKLNEETNRFVDRCWFIVKNKGKYPEKELICRSHMYVNEKILGVIY